MATGKVFVRDATGLVRQFGSFDLILIAAGMIFPLEAAVLEFPWFYGFSPGADLTVSLCIATLPFIVLMLVYWAMGVIMPRAGNDYVWTGRIFGPLVGFAWAAYYMLATFGGGFVATAGAVGYAVSTSLSVGGSLYNSPAATAAGIWLTQPFGEFLIAWAFTILIFVVTLFGKATARALLYVGWLGAVLGTALMWGLLGTTSPAAFAAKWNLAFSQYTTYEGMLKVATSSGWSPTAISFSSTLSAFPLAILFLLGGNFVNGVAGEVKNVKKAIPLSLLASLFIGLIFWVVSSSLAVSATGYNWLTAVGYLWDNAPNAYSAAMPFPPTMPMMLGLIAYPNEFVFFLIALGFVLGSFPGLLFYFWIPSRYFFAWGFDRILPEKMASVNERLGTPTYAVTAIFLLSTLYIGLIYLAGFSSVLGIVTLLWFSSFILPCLGLAVVPYWKPEYFRLAPGFMQKKIAGIPLLTIFGSLAVVSFCYATYLAVVNPLLASVTTLSTELTVGTVVLAVVIYYVSLWYHNKKGIDIRLAFKAIPPE